MSPEKPENPPTRASEISGHIYSSNGSSLKGAKVVCGEMETRTLADGSFRLGVAVPGAYDVTASLQGYESAKEAVSVQQGEKKALDLRLPKAIGTARINGHIYDAKSKKVVELGGTAILVMPVANKYSHISQSGYYEFANLPGGSYTIRISAPGYADSDAVLTVDDAETKMHDFFCKPQKTEEPPWG